MILKVAIDESGTHAGAPALALGAVLGNKSQWKRFAKAWTMTAARYPDGFHSTAAVAADRLRLAQLMETHLLGAMTVRVPYADYAAVVTQSDRSKLGGEYLAALKMTLGFLHILMDTYKIPEMELVIEAGHTHGTAAADAYLSAVVADKKRFRLHSYAWVGKEEMPVHAADLAAHAYASSEGVEAGAQAILDRITRRIEPSREDLAETTELVLRQLSEYRYWKREYDRAVREGRIDLSVQSSG